MINLFQGSGEPIPELAFRGPPPGLPLILSQPAPSSPIVEEPEDRKRWRNTTSLWAPSVQLSPKDDQSSVVVTKEKFLRNFSLFHGGTVSRLKPEDWSNMIIAGGSICQSLTGCSHDQNADIDIFFYG